MTAADFAGMVGARKVGKGKWIAKCVAHPDRNPSLSINEGSRGVLVSCRSHGCTVREICAALGIRVADLFYDAKVSEETRARLSLAEQLERLERQLGLVAVLGAIDGKPAYWMAAERRIRSELDEVRCQLDPVTVLYERRGAKFREQVRRHGIEWCWRQVPETV